MSSGHTNVRLKSSRWSEYGGIIQFATTLMFLSGLRSVTCCSVVVELVDTSPANGLEEFRPCSVVTTTTDCLIWKPSRTVSPRTLRCRCDSASASWMPSCTGSEFTKVTLTVAVVSFLVAAGCSVTHAKAATPRLRYAELRFRQP